MEEQEIRDGVVNAFQFLLFDNLDWLVEIDVLPFATLNLEEADNLEVSFREEEIRGVLFDMNGDKAPGPDGFALAFW